ncbi:DNA methyltransferase [Marinospirillum insulare]|uniref:DNA methyltransferase n=1 Tax=Marinospirillum insulare TaxID=217169 RepID=UPI00068D4003|nr:DNA methyltransferase [Marinospirillum insulare]
MTQAVKLREKLVNKLSDLFQLNQPDLDFGFYRIMHAKAAQVQQFIDQDLLTIITNAFGQADDNQVATARGKYEAAIQQAKDFGAPNPEETKPVQEAKAAYDAARESGSNEAQVYDHLYRFFERYYDDGDFISRRYYTRETASNAAPYAIPYNGEEVKLHWANADQYYIKSAEHFSNFSFDLRQAKEVQAQEGLDFGQSAESHKVHFQIIDASEGEHGNIKAADNAKREFVLHTAQPVALNDANELIVNFEYRVLSSQDTLTKEQEEAVKKEFGASNKGDLPNLHITRQILAAAKALDSLPADYLTLLSTPAPTDKIKQRPLLAKYINQYTSRNTMDYFIHKDLGSFLRRELDFYIKNEVMRLDDIENADAPAVESYLSKIKVLRQIAHKLIDFLAQLEDFQKKLWLKKKFVTETNYCITLDRVPVELYPEICANQAQLTEWIQLFAIDEIQGDLTTPAFSNPLTVEFLQANQNLVLDTQFFSEQFKAQLLASIDDFDEQCDGLLIHSENFQALQLLQERYREQVKCVYIDPPYNTAKKDFSYKDGYKSSSWISLSSNRLNASKPLLNKDSVFFSNIDENEFFNYQLLLAEHFGSDNFVGDWVWHNKKGGGNDSTHLAVEHEYIKCFAYDKSVLAPFFQPYTDIYLKRPGFNSQVQLIKLGLDGKLL